jgi:hypothetical protein
MQSSLWGKLGQTVLALFWIVVLASLSHAQFITIAPGGPSGYSGETMYGPPYAPPPFTGPGAFPLIFPPPPPNPPMPPGAYIVDALSSAADAGSRYLFSVGAGAMGLPATPVAFEALFGTGPSQFFPGPPALGGLPPEPEGDIFMIFGPAFGVLGAALPFAFPVMPADEFFLGLNVGDDLNGLMMRAPGAGIGAAYYSLAAAGLGPGFYMPADVISPALPLGAAWAPAPALSLDIFGPGTDDIDALIVQDLSPLAFFAPGDFVAFSLTPASATLGALGPGYAPGGGDLLVPDGPADADPFPDIFIPAAAFGLTPFDNLDAIEVAPPLPVRRFRLVDLDAAEERFRLAFPE